jgi:hypothetical protein
MATSETTASDRGAVTLTCPECGKTFTRAAAMGAHRSRVHGVAGTSRNTTSTRTRRKRSDSATKTPAAAAVASRARTASASVTNGGPDRDTLLRTVFPNGIPPKQDVIQSVNSWLDEAERLSRLR